VLREFLYVIYTLRFLAKYIAIPNSKKIPPKNTILKIFVAVSGKLPGLAAATSSQIVGSPMTTFLGDYHLYHTIFNLLF